MSRFAILAFGLVSYAIGMASLLYAMGFIGNLVVPKTIDSGVRVPLTEALIVNVLLLGLFAVQHSVMARQQFKALLTRSLPVAAERSLYVLLSGLVLALLYWQWRPIPDQIWHVENDTLSMAIWALYFLGWGIIVASTFLISHFQLMGLKQVYRNLLGQPHEPQAEFKTPLLYKIVRHPIYFGMLLVFWAAPTMTVGHLLFSVGATGYILIGASLEERDLIAVFGDAYRKYRREVSMLIPWPKRGG
jgi:protein-S-isoprenylcysteine O-methyltransferase Ste14